MKIKVTKEDIDNGVGGSGTSCPIALALKRTLKINEGTDNSFWVCPREIVINYKKYQIPVVRYFAYYFDKIKKENKENNVVDLSNFQPFSFVIDI